MKTKTFSSNITLVMLVLLIATFTMVLLPTQTASAEETTQDMFRLYNPNSGEHFYTASTVERDHLTDVGWSYEGTGWTAPTQSDTPVYRLYNANAGDHHYTTSVVERDHLVSVGWNDEGVGWYSDDGQSVALYRQYNPNAVAGSHNYTASGAERDNLVSVGWQDEGIAWYGVSEGVAVVPDNPSADEQDDQSILTDKNATETTYNVDDEGNMVPDVCYIYCEKTWNHRHMWVYTGGTSYGSILWPGGKVTHVQKPCRYCSACRYNG